MNKIVNMFVQYEKLWELDYYSDVLNELLLSNDKWY